MFLKTSQIRQLSFLNIISVGIVLSSIIFLPLTGVGFTLPKLVILSCTAVAISLWLLLYADISPLCILIHSGWLGWSILLYAVAIVLSVFTSSIPILSTVGADPRIEGILTYVLYGVIFLFALCTAVNKKGRELLFHTILYVNIAVIGYGTLQFAGLDPLYFIWNNQAFLNRVFSFLGHPNALGAFIVLTFPIAVLALLRARKNMRILYIVLLALNGVVLMGTASRSAMIGAVLLIVAYCILTPETRLQFKKISSMHKAVIVWIAVGIFIIGYISFLHRFSLEGAQSRSLQSRAVIWSDALHMLKDNPKGFGLETMGTLYPQYKNKKLLITESLRTGVDRAHSNPIDLLITVGPIGLIALYTFFILLFRRCIALRNKEEEIYVCGLGIFGYMVTLLFGFQTVVTATICWLMIGWIMGIVWQHMKLDIPCRLWMRYPIILLCGLCICANIIFMRWSIQRVYVARAEQYFASGKLSDTVGELYRASSLFVFDRTLLVRFAETALLAAEYSHDRVQRDAFLDIAQQAIAQLDVVTNGYDGMIPLLRGWAAAINADTASVRGYMEEAKQKMPTTVDTYRIAAHSYRLVGDIVAAMKMEYELKNLLPEYWREKDNKARLFWKENPWLQDLADK